MKPLLIRFSLFAFALISGGLSFSPGQAAASEPRAINLLVDCSHDYSFNLSNASRTQNEIFPGIQVLTANQTLHKLNLDPINALVVLMDGKLPYLPEDAPHLLAYVSEGGGLYLGVRADGVYGGSLKQFLQSFGLKVSRPLSDDPREWGISVHAPSEMRFALSSKVARFTATVGLHHSAGGSVVFQVFGDGRLLAETKVMRRGIRETLDVDVSGLEELRLVSTDAGDGNGSDHSVWFDPRVISKDGKSTRLLLEEASEVKVGWGRATQDRHLDGRSLIQDGSTAPARSKGLYPHERVEAYDWPALPGVQSRVPGLMAFAPFDWQPLFENERGEPVLLVAQYGKGYMVADGAGLYGAAVEKRQPQQEVMQRLLRLISIGKSVEPVAGGGGWQFSEGYRWDRITTVEGGLRIHHTDYSEMYVQSDIRAFRETVGYLKAISGLDEKQKAAQIALVNDRKAAAMRGAEIDVDVSGIQTLTLLSTDGGDGIGSDHSIFARNVLVDRSGQERPLRLEDASTVSAGYGRPVQDALNDGSPLSIGGQEFDQGIFLHANGRIEVSLNGAYARFRSHVGCLDRTQGGSVGFRVLGDGRELWNDGKVYRGGFPDGNPNDVNYVPEGILFQLKYLPCVGSGFLLPQGSAVDLPPALKDDWQVHLGMLAHEMGHAWSYPFTEPCGEEASAFLFNNLVLHRHYGQRHGDSVPRRLTGYLQQHDLEDIDLAVSGNNFKYYMFLDLMVRQYGEEIWKNYNLLKYALLPLEGVKWNAHTSAWLWSIAAGEDVFPYFQTAFGSSMDPKKAGLPPEVLAMGFDPVRVGARYEVPLQRLPRQRNILDGLQRFEDVWAFYERERMEKGHPDVEG